MTGQPPRAVTGKGGSQRGRGAQGEMWRGGVVPCALFSPGLSSEGWLQLDTHEGGLQC